LNQRLVLVSYLSVLFFNILFLFPSLATFPCGDALFLTIGAPPFLLEKSFWVSESETLGVFDLISGIPFFRMWNCLV